MLQVLFAGFFVLVFGYGMYEVWDIPLLARIFPFWISLIAFVLSLMQLTIEVRRSLAPEPDRGAELADITPGMIYGRALYYVIWLLGLYIAIWLIGFVIAMTLFVFAFLRWEANKGWVACASMSLSSALFLVVVSWIMTLYWPEGRLGEAVGLPWPLK